MKSQTILTLCSLVVGAIALAVACGPAGFQSEDVIDSVRILATRADGDEAYAKPGDLVTLETLTVDGRSKKPAPAVTYWIPYLCENPASDLYYGCFAPLLGGDAGASAGPTFDAGGGGGADAGAPEGGALDAGAEDAGNDDGGDAGAPPAPPPPTPTPVISPGALAGIFAAGADITPYLSTGPFTFVVPQDIILRHPVATGIEPYGLVIVFNIACAGRVKTTAIDPAAGPQQVPLGCYDEAGNALGADQYVIGFTRVYVSATKSDKNPSISGFLFNGTETPIDAGSALPAPIDVKVPACHGTCPGVPIDLDAPQPDWTPQSKSVWVEYYAMGGNLGAEGRLLYDLTAGRTTDTGHEVVYSPPDDPGPATIWAVVHDSNDGVTWLQVNVTAQ
jgi:hypothetical protein